MAIINPKLIYVPRTVDELRDGMLRDYRLFMLETNGVEPAVAPGSEPYLRFQSIATNMLGLYANIEISANDASLLDAQGTALDNIRSAYGLAEKPAAAASGKLVATLSGAGAVTFTDGTQFVTPNGLRGEVSGSQTVSTSTTLNLDVVMIDTGSASNQDGGITVRWVSPPLNSSSTAEVYVDGLTGGSDDETDEQKRTRILEHLASPPASGNWSFYTSLGDDSTAAIAKSFCYPALGGPGSIKMVIQKDMVLSDTAAKKTQIDLSHEVSETIRLQVQNYIEASSPEPIELVVQSVADYLIDVSILMELPSAKSGAEGWETTSVFPVLTVSDDVVSVTNLSADKLTITLDALTTDPPQVGDQIAWWCSTTGEFVKSTILSYSGVSGAWVLTLSDLLFVALDDGTTVEVQVGDIISPAATNMNDYALLFLQQLNFLGPGENTDNPNITRGKRRPEPASTWGQKITSRFLFQLIDTYPEIIDLKYGLNAGETTPPPVPATVNTAPNIYTIRNLAIYEVI